MMVPRSYQFRSSKPAYPSGTNEKDGVATAVKERSPKAPKKNDKTSGTGKPAWLSSPMAATPSKPVVIPTRTRNTGTRTTKESPAKSRRISKTGRCHDPDSVPSSVAALLAMTSVPEPKPQPQDSTMSGSRYASKLGRRQEPGDGHLGCSISTSSPQSWGVLLSPPDEFESEYGSVGSNTTVGAESFVRSLSTESMPSLDEDCESSTSPSSSIPSTPGWSIRSHNGYERRPKELSSPKTEDCVLDHPLLPVFPIDELTSDDDVEPPLTRRNILSTSTSTLKSNLSASIALIRSAARSFTNFTAPAISRDEYLTRSLLSTINPPFTDERRPPPSHDPPDPALRRYLNPINLSPSELHIHHDHPQSAPNYDRCTASVQLQSYKRVPRPFDKASAPPIFASSKETTEAAIVGAAEEPFSIPGPKQREPRENSDFLRVIVLEMNMRRSGQLGDGAPGKARMSLPARLPSKKEGESIESGMAKEGVPRRWVAVDAY